MLPFPAQGSGREGEESREDGLGVLVAAAAVMPAASLSAMDEWLSSRLGSAVLSLLPFLLKMSLEKVHGWLLKWMPLIWARGKLYLPTLNTCGSQAEADDHGTGPAGWNQHRPGVLDFERPWRK